MLNIIDCEFCTINYSKHLLDLAEVTKDLLKQKIKEYEMYFDESINEKIIVNYFDNIDEFRNFIYEIRGEKDSLPSYAKGTYDKGMINAFVNSDNQLSRKYTASHELFHILYMKFVLKNDYSKRIIWYDEGMAQFLSGEKDKLKDKEQFKEFYLKVREETKTIPNLNVITHGPTFYNDEYNGYDLSYLSIRYIFETRNIEKFKSLMYDLEQIKLIGEDIIYRVFEYYDQEFKS